MNNYFERTEMLFGKENMEKLKNSVVAVFGNGGVGSYTVEALARTGVGVLILTDADTVDITNINRQLIATVDTVGLDKVEAERTRIKSINPDIEVVTKKEFITVDTDLSFLKECDYVVDAIDTVSAKLHIAEFCYKNNIKLISAMGAGNKTDPTRFTVSDIYKTSVCPLCRVMRYNLRKRGVKSLKVVYSTEEPKNPSAVKGVRTPPASLAFVPSVMGLIIAKEVVFGIIGDNFNGQE